MPELPNVRKAVVTHLRADAAVTQLVPATRIGHRSEAAYPRLRVLRVGGTSDGYYLDQCLIQMDAVGEPDDYSEPMQERLEAITAAAVASVYDGMRNATSSGVRVSSVNVLTNQQSAPDDSTRQLRVFARLLLTAHAVPA
jgi:hypothetical protein